MAEEIPKLKTRSDRVNLNVSVDSEVDRLYREAKQAGIDAPEIARRAVTEAIRRLEPKLKGRSF